MSASCNVVSWYIVHFFRGQTKGGRLLRTCCRGQIKQKSERTVVWGERNTNLRADARERSD